MSNFIHFGCWNQGICNINSQDNPLSRVMTKLLEYTMEYVDDTDPNDAVVEQGGACVMVAPTAQMFLLGSVIDYEVSLLESGFKFNNHNVTEECGCGESIKFADA